MKILLKDAQRTRGVAGTARRIGRTLQQCCTIPLLKVATGLVLIIIWSAIRVQAQWVKGEQGNAWTFASDDVYIYAGHTGGLFIPGDTTVVVVAYDRIQNVFGKLRRQWGLYEKSLNSSAYGLEEVTDSIGKTYEISEPGIIVNCLHGAIINGTRYGTITDVVFSDLSYPEDFKLLQNFPNPFNNSTIITLTLPKEEYITVRIFDIIGRDIRKLFDGKTYTGVQRFVWDGKNDFGYEVGSGTYVHQVRSSNFITTMKMILEK